MKLSASQLETANEDEQGCLRKWAFQYKLRLPTYKKDHFGFGTCLHGVCERFLIGAKDLYPDGWDIDPDTKKRISPADASLIKVLIEKGISSGILERRPGGVVEAWFSVPAGTGTVVGKIDHEVPSQFRVEDHKTAKNRNYIKKTGKALAKNLQMLIYAFHQLYEIRKRGQVDPRIITIAHNQYIKAEEGQPLVSRVEAELTPRQIDDYWEEVVLPLVAKVEAANELDNPFDLPMPGKEACNAFGGCPFMTLCANTEDVLTFVARINNMNGTIPDPNKPMSDAMQKFLAGRTAAVPPASTTVSVNPPAAAAAPAVAVVAAPAQARLTPPWLSDKCTLCKTRPNPGFSNDGSPCRICVGASKHDISQYEWRAEPDGKLIWWKKGTTAPVAAVAPAVAAATPTKVHYTIDSLRADLAKCTTSDAVIALIDTATEALGDGSPELQVFMGMVEKTLEKLETPPAPVAGVPVAAPGMVVSAPPAPALAVAPALEAAAPAAPQLAPTPPPAEEAPKRRGRPPGSKGAPKEAAPDAPAPATTGGFVLMIGCAPIQGRAFAGLKTRFAEDVLSDLPGYWDGEAFARRDQVSKAAAGIAEALVGCCIVQNVPDPDTNVLIRALVPYASVVIAKSGM